MREVPQASTGFSPFELLYGRQPRGVLDVLRETWEEGPLESKNKIQHVLDLRTKLHTLGQLSMENLLQAQDKQSRLYNRGTRLRNFAPGDKVLVLLPTSSSKLLAKWQGPFEVTRRLGDLSYEVIRMDQSGAPQIYHLSLLKKWSEVEPVMLAISGEDDLRPEVNTKKTLNWLLFSLSLKKTQLDPKDLVNYRPISNLPFLSKIKVASSQLYSFLEKNYICEDFQSGFRPSHSTETALIGVTNDLLLSSDRGCISLLVLLDLSAVFDTIDHNILLNRLENSVGIIGSALAWFKSYLSDCHQFVKVNEEVSY